LLRDTTASPKISIALTILIKSCIINSCAHKISKKCVMLLFCQDEEESVYNDEKGLVKKA